MLPVRKIVKSTSQGSQRDRCHTVDPRHPDANGAASNNMVRCHLNKLAEAGHLSEKAGRIALGPRYAVSVHYMTT